MKNYEIYMEFDGERFGLEYITSNAESALDCFRELIEQSQATKVYSGHELLDFWEKKTFDDNEGVRIICEVTEI